MSIELQGKPICITGASSGIGLTTARRLARAGMPVVLNARRVDRLERHCEEIRRDGGRAIVVPGDIADPEVSSRMVEACVHEFGSVYSVFANAGYGVETPVHEMTDEDIRRMFEVNFFGTMHTIRAALPFLRRARAGHILICSSCLAKFTIPYFGVYSATKAAQNHISRAMKLELGPEGIHVSSVHPVGTRTEFFDVAQQLSGGAPMVQHTPSFLLQPADKVARAIERCIRSPRAEVWTSAFVRFGMAFSMPFPRLADMGVKGMVKEWSAKRAASGDG